MCVIDFEKKEMFFKLNFAKKKSIKFFGLINFFLNIFIKQEINKLPGILKEEGIGGQG